MDPIKTILVPVDFDAHSQPALDTAIRFARNLGAKITLLHVEPYNLADVSQDAFFQGPNASTRARTSALEALRALADGQSASGVPINVETRQGIVWDEILGAAQHLGAELIVMGTHGRKGFARGILGSVTEQVVRASKAPVMTVRAGDG